MLPGFQFCGKNNCYFVGRKKVVLTQFFVEVAHILFVYKREL